MEMVKRSVSAVESKFVKNFCQKSGGIIEEKCRNRSRRRRFARQRVRSTSEIDESRHFWKFFYAENVATCQRGTNLIGQTPLPPTSADRIHPMARFCTCGRYVQGHPWERLLIGSLVLIPWLQKNSLQESDSKHHRSEFCIFRKAEFWLVAPSRVRSGTANRSSEFSTWSRQ